MALTVLQLQMAQNWKGKLGYQWETQAAMYTKLCLCIRCSYFADIELPVVTEIREKESEREKVRVALINYTREYLTSPLH